jgi:hypothetical protein
VAPHDLYEPDFVSLRAQEIAGIESRIGSNADLATHLQKISQAKQGIANPLVSWGLLQTISLEQWLEAFARRLDPRLEPFFDSQSQRLSKGFPGPVRQSPRWDSGVC